MRWFEAHAIVEAFVVEYQQLINETSNTCPDECKYAYHEVDFIYSALRICWSVVNPEFESHTVSSKKAYTKYSICDKILDYP